MGEFIRVEIDLKRCLGLEKCGKCVRVCPVNIFTSRNDTPEVVGANEDECTLCDLCIQACGVDAISVRKLYEE
jgi:NAD-dependent dihydropyrimidine dehydrogenase PreA subunit